MTEQAFDAAVARLQESGFTLVQQGAITRPFEKGVSFAERAEGFDLHMLGTFAAPTWKSQFQNSLLDTDTRWAHLRRPRVDD